jgi:hypothetical protein
MGHRPRWGTPPHKVERIVWYDVERVPNHNGEENSGVVATDPGVVVWERKKHKMLGIPFEHQDWIWWPSGDCDPEEVVWHPEALADGKGPGREVKRSRTAVTFQAILKRCGDMGISKSWQVKVSLI